MTCQLDVLGHDGGTLIGVPEQTNQESLGHDGSTLIGQQTNRPIRRASLDVLSMMVIIGMNEKITLNCEYGQNKNIPGKAG